MANVAAVIELLTAKKIAFEVLHHKATFRSAEEADTLHVDRDDVLKTVVLDTGSGHVIAVTPASGRLDMGLVREAVADERAHLATEREMSLDFPSFELGFVPPLPSLARVPVFVDPEIVTHKTVVFAGTSSESVRVKTEDLFSGEYVTVAPLVQRFNEFAHIRG